MRESHISECFAPPSWPNSPRLTGPRFILNGLRHANEILRHEAFRPEDWEVIGEYVYDNEGGRHQAFYAPIRDTTVLGEKIRAHERVQVEQSLKYSEDGMKKLWNAAGVAESSRWMVDGDEYGT